MAEDQLERAAGRRAREVVRRDGFVSPEAADAVLRAGFSTAHLLEALAVIGMTILANYTHNLAGTPVDAAFARHSWTPPEAARAS